MLAPDARSVGVQPCARRDALCELELPAMRASTSAIFTIAAASASLAAATVASAAFAAAALFSSSAAWRAATAASRAYKFVALYR